MAIGRKQKRAMIRKSYRDTRANRKPLVQATITIRDTAAKLLILDTLIRISARHKLRKPFPARYQQARRGSKIRRLLGEPTERFLDGKSFERLRKGDCADATVHFGALLRQQGVKAFPILQYWQRKGRGPRILHALLYLPDYQVIVDPTFIYFPKFRGKGKVVRYPTRRDLIAIGNQLDSLYGR